MWKRLVQSLTEMTFRMLGGLFPPVAGSLTGNPRLILAFSTTGIGDALFDTAAVRSLRIAYPQARIILCAHRKRRTVFLHDPDVDEVVPYGKSPFYAVRLIRRFRRERPDLVLLLRTNEEVVPIGYCINRRALYGPDWRAGKFAFLLSHPVRMPAEGHILSHGTVVSEAAGGKTGSPRMIYSVKEEEREAVAGKCPEWVNAPFIVFQTGGGRSLSWRNWPVASYVRIINWLSGRSNLRIVLTGGRDNEQIASAIKAACPQVVNLCSETTLEETAALLTFATMLVSTDTGVMHLGFAVGCPTLALLHHASPAGVFGPSDRSAGHEVIELSKPVGGEAETGEEMARIRDRDVQAAIARILERKGIHLLIPDEEEN